MTIDLQTFEARIWLVARALQAAVRTSNVPQRIDYFFPDPGSAHSGDPPFDKWEAPTHVMRELRDRKWQANFLAILSSRGAVTVSGNFASVKNRYFFENLIQGVKRRGPEYSVMLDLVWLASGGEAGGWKNLVGNEKPQQATPSTPPPAPEPEEQADLAVDAPAELEEEVHEEPPRDAMTILRRIEDMVTAVLTIEEKLAENIIYVRDRGDKLHEKFKSLNERIAALEAKLEIPVPQEPQEPVIDAELHQQVQSVIASVNSMGEAVSSMKQDVQQVIDATLNQKPSDRILEIQSSLARITSEFGALRELALETFAESSQ